MCACNEKGRCDGGVLSHIDQRAPTEVDKVRAEVVLDAQRPDVVLKGVERLKQLSDGTTARRVSQPRTDAQTDEAESSRVDADHVAGGSTRAI
jgi:hypothetical protein